MILKQHAANLHYRSHHSENIMAFDRELLKTFPEFPGVYLMKDNKGEVLYVGKAKNLKNRLKQYFGATQDERHQIPYLLSHLHVIETIVVHSEKEALLLENKLIRHYKPPYNLLSKDDKSQLNISITTKHPYPKIELVRTKDACKKGVSYFGPFTRAQQARQMFDLTTRLFLLRQCSDEEFARRVRPCMLYQIKRCTAPCTQKISKEEYEQNVQKAIRFLNGNTSDVIQGLKAKIETASEALDFEKAGYYHKSLIEVDALKTLKSTSIHLQGKIDAWDFYREGEDIVITKLCFRNNAIISSEHFEYEYCFEEADDLLETFLLSHYLTISHDLPEEILLPSNKMRTDVLEEILREKAKKKVSFLVPKRAEKRRLLQLCKTNAEAAFRQRKTSADLLQKALVEIQDAFGIKKFPEKIECFDNSHLSGHDLVSCMVSFVNGQKYKNGYRKFAIKTVSTPDDYAMMKEVLIRRYSKVKEGEELTDLILIDGGKGHLHIAMKVLQELGILNCTLVAITKEQGRHDKGMTQERFFIFDRSEPVVFEQHSPALHLLQKIRDEAHRFAITYQRDRRTKSTIKSALDNVPGIGPVKKRKLLKAFGSVKGILEATKDEVMSACKLTKKDVDAVFEVINSSYPALS